MADDRWRGEEWRRGDDERSRHGRQRYGQGGGYGHGEPRPHHEHPESQSQWDERPGYGQDQRRRFGEGGSRHQQGGWYSGEDERHGSEGWRGGYGEGGVGGGGWSGTGGWTGGGFGGGYLGGRGSSRSGYGSEGQDWGGEGFGGGSYSRGHGGAGYSGRGQDWAGGSYGEGWAGGRREAGYGRGREQDRSWFDRATDEVSSWLGDDDAERRRRRDQERSGHYGKGPRGYSRSDDRIREDVSDRLTEDWQIDASEIEVVVSSGEVTLNGTVVGREEKRRAEDLAETVSGVRHVQNNLRLSSGTGLPSTEGSTTGARIRQSGSTDTTNKR